MEYPIMKSYIEWAADLPYSVSSSEQYDLPLARQVLDS